MSSIVTKFGGSSVADRIQLEKIKGIIAKDERRKYVVVSAPGKRFQNDNKITDVLYLTYASKEQNLPYDQLLQVVEDRFLAIAANLGSKVDVKKEMDVIRGEMEKGCSKDYIASRGEFLTAMLVADYLGFEFVDAEGLILFDEKGKMLVEETNKALDDELKKHDKAVIPGFYGSYLDGTIKTFSRGGSDITGSVVARAVKADVYENWTDVSGFLMADPRIVDNPKPINHITYMELRELSYMGASVLHEDAIYPARMAGIPINIRNTNAPEDPGTMITAEVGDRDPETIVTGIAGKKDFTVISMYKANMSSKRSFIRRILGILEDYSCSFERIPSGIDTVSVIIPGQDIGGRLEEMMDTFKERLNPDSIEADEHVSMIATVGWGMSKRPGVAARLFTAIANADINLRLIEQGSSEVNIIIGVANNDYEKAIRAIYNEFSVEA